MICVTVRTNSAINKGLTQPLPIREEPGVKKAILPYNVAKAIENIRKRREGERTLFNYPSIANHAAKNKDYSTINAYINQSEENFKNYFNAILNGFDIEKAPKEKVKERYVYYKQNNLQVSANAMKETLDLLGVVVEGVNA